MLYAAIFPSVTVFLPIHLVFYSFNHLQVLGLSSLGKISDFSSE